MRVALESSNLKAVDYVETDETTKDGTLTIWFHSGDAWEYYDCPERHYDGIINAPSSGKYFHANIKGKYRCQKA